MSAETTTAPAEAQKPEVAVEEKKDVGTKNGEKEAETGDKRKAEEDINTDDKK